MNKMLHSKSFISGILVAGLLLAYLHLTNAQFFINMDKVLPRLGKKMDVGQFEAARPSDLSRYSAGYFGYKGGPTGYRRGSMLKRINMKDSLLGPQAYYSPPDNQISIYGKAAGVPDGDYNVIPKGIFLVQDGSQQQLSKVDGDSVITLNDFVKASPLYYMPMDKRIRLFEMLDLNGDGILDQKELAQAQLGKN